jgi:hypothetical protein
MKLPHADLFICFNEDEHLWVQRAAETLEARLEVVEGGRVRRFLCFYYTQDMRIGDDWHERMLELAASANRLLFVVSPGSLASFCCKLEINQRVRRHHLGLEAMLCGNRVPNVEPLNTPAGFVLGHEVWADLLDHRSFDEQFDELVGWLCRARAGERFHVRRKPDPQEICLEPLVFEAAFARFLPCLGLVTSAADALPMGCAWFAEGRRFTCDWQTARAAAAQLAQGHAFLYWCDGSGGFSHCLSITHVREPLEDLQPGALYVTLNDALPERPPRAPEPVFFPHRQLGVVVATTSGRDGVAARAAAIHWQKGGGVEAAIEPGERWLPGAPIFDALGRFAGYLTCDHAGLPIALPVRNMD